MKYTTIAVAALAGVAVASESWGTYGDKDVKPTKKPSPKPVDPEATWTEWDPKHPKPTKKPEDGEHWDDWDPEHPDKIGTWGDWDPKHPKPTKKPDAEHWDDWDPEHPDKIGTWGEWDPKHPKPTAKPEHWDDWDPEHPDKIGTWGEWDPKHPKPTGKKPKDGEHWDDWDPEHPDKVGTWGTWKTPAPTTTASCSYTKEYTKTKCFGDKKCFEKVFTKTLYPTDCGVKTWSEWQPAPTEETTWSEWDPSAKPVTVTKTASWEEVPVVVTSVVKPGWSSNGWFGPAWPTVAPGACGKNIVTSYGAPIWKPVPEPSTTTTWVEWKETPTPEAPKPKPEVGKGFAPIKPNGNKWSMTYSPYQANTDCKTEETIKADIKKLAGLGFTSVRVYSTDCKTLEYVGKACRENNIKMILGVYISKSGIEGAKGQVKDIVQWAQWDIVELIVIGNEAVFNKFCNADDLVWFIKYCKDAFKAAGYNGGCTTTEPLAEWEKDGHKFCDVVDVVAANLYAYFNAETSCDKAGDFIQAQVDILGGICKGKETYVMESGWPSEGVCNGKACPSKENQKVAVKKIQETVGAKVVFFSFEDEQWKEPGEFGVEQHWGCSDVFEGADWTNVKPAPTSTNSWENVKPAPTSTNSWENVKPAPTQKPKDPWSKW